MEQISTDSEYFERRANEETAAAERASDERARMLHMELAQRYSTAARSGGAADGAEATPAPPAALLQPEFRILR